MTVRNVPARIGQAMLFQAMPFLLPCQLRAHARCVLLYLYSTSALSTQSGFLLYIPHASGSIPKMEPLPFLE